jgi:hypothetical protein
LVVPVWTLQVAAVLRWLAQGHGILTDPGGNQGGKDGRVVRLQTFAAQTILRRIAQQVLILIQQPFLATETQSKTQMFLCVLCVSVAIVLILIYSAPDVRAS